MYPNVLVPPIVLLLGKVLLVILGSKTSNDSGNLIKLTVKKGDAILYGKYSGTEITVDGNDVLIMRESDILATL